MGGSQAASVYGSGPARRELTGGGIESLVNNNSLLLPGRQICPLIHFLELARSLVRRFNN